MARFKCGYCDRWHDGEIPQAIAFKKPEQYFNVPEHERQKRVRCSNDLCSIDDKEFFIRGVLKIPIQNSDRTFEWGLWAMVEERDFFRYIELCKKDAEEEEEAPFIGWLANMPMGYPRTNILEVSIHLQPEGKRPLFRVLSEHHPLGLDQQNGISLEKVHHIFAEFRATYESG